jgi:hypothetical protein
MQYHIKLRGIFILLCVFSFQIQAQVIDLPFKGELDIKFSKNDNDKLVKCVISIQEAKVQLAEAKSMYDKLEEEDRLETDFRKSKEMREIYKKLKSAISSFDNGYNGIYDVYKSNCVAFWDHQKTMGRYVTGIEKAKYYERMATRALGRGQTRRGDAEVSKKFNDAYMNIVEGNSYFYQSIRSQGRALQIYQDYPVEYNYGWENDIDIDEILAHKKDPIIMEAQVDTSVQRFKNDTLMQDTKIVYIYDTIFIIIKDTLDFADTSVTFRVQIAAHNEPLSQEYLRTIYFGSRDIFELEEEGWYKYSIGLFKDYFEARKILDQSGVAKAFLVPYVEGIKITMREALIRMGIDPEQLQSSGSKAN